MQRFDRTRQHREQNSSQTGQAGLVEPNGLDYEWPAKEKSAGEGRGLSQNNLSSIAGHGEACEQRVDRRLLCDKACMSRDWLRLLQCVYWWAWMRGQKGPTNNRQKDFDDDDWP